MTEQGTMRRPIRAAAGVLVVAALSGLPALSGCADVDSASASEASLERFTSCASLNDYARSRALELVGPYGFGGAGVVRTLPFRAPQTEGDAVAQSAATAGGPDYSSTNVQEAGIDEPDIVKSDGHRIFALARNRIYAIDASGSQPRIAGSLTLGDDGVARDMLLAGTTLLVMRDGSVHVGREGTSTARSSPSLAPMSDGSVLTTIDVTDPAAMRVLQSLETDARYVTARLSAATARIVVAGSPTVFGAFTYPQQPGPAAAAGAAAENRRVLARTTADDWIPRYVVRGAGGTSPARPIAPCTAVSRPSVFSGLDSLTVLTVDLARGLDPVDADTVMASGEHVYASEDALYVATNRWAADAGVGAASVELSTQIHAFATPETAQTTYRGSGAVAGHLLNQFSMSEHEGRLRVATTTDSAAFVGADTVVRNEARPQSESAVSVLEERDGKLRQVGRVAGLGRGERIFAVRFVGPTAYVVTFRQTDPLYTLDLSNPAAPRVAGELKIAGYSSYLHPIGDGLVIGVGQDADERGTTTGLQVSLFDVSDPASPRRLQQGVMPGASSEAEWDHHAFLWWPATQTAVIPFSQVDTAVPVPTDGDGSPGTDPSGATASAVVPVRAWVGGAIAMRVTRTSIGEIGRVHHPVSAMVDAGIRRSLVIGDLLYTVSDAGVRASGLSDLGERAWLPFP